MNGVQTEIATPAAGSDPAAQPSDGTDTGSGGDGGGNGGDGGSGGGNGGGSDGDRNTNDPSGGGGDGNGNGNGTNEGQIQVTGVLTDEGVECRALRARNGQLYTLAGDTDRFNTGDTVRVTGSRAEMSFCQQGTTINVNRIEQAS